VVIFVVGLGPDDGDRTYTGRLTWNDPPGPRPRRPGCRCRDYNYRMKAGTTYTTA